MGFVTDIRNGIRWHLTPAVRTIFYANIVIWLVSLLLGFNTMSERWIVSWLALWPGYAIFGFRFWQFGTYMFVHLEMLHLLFNMIALWFFGPELEQRLGTRFFWIFYLGTGLGAGVLHGLVTALTGAWASPLIGASGALYAVMLAYGCYWPDRMILFYGVFPMKMKYLVMLAGFMAFMSSIGGGGGGVSHLTHLTGLIAGYLLLAWHHRNFDLRRWRWQY